MNETAIFAAARNANFEMMQLFIDHGADVNHQDFFGSTLAHLATEKKSIPMIQFLLRRNGADFKIQNKDGLTPMEVALKVETQDDAKSWREFLDACRRRDNAEIERFLNNAECYSL